MAIDATYAPATAAEALARWDAGDIVQTIEMGGMGDGYELAIHITAFEHIREVLKVGPLSDWNDEDAMRKLLEQVEAVVVNQPEVSGITGAMWGAAVNISIMTVRRGWAEALGMAPEDRLIFVSKAGIHADPSATGSTAMPDFPVPAGGEITEPS